MINAESRHGGVAVMMEGEITELLDEFTSIIRSFRVKLEDDVDDEFARMVIAVCGQLAFGVEEGEADDIMEELEAFLDKKAKDLGVDRG